MASPAHQANMVTIRVLCVNMPATASPLILTNCDLDMTIETLQRRIAANLDPIVMPERLRLIFRGKRFSNRTPLRYALAPIDGNEFAVHLTIAPEPVNEPPTNEPPTDQTHRPLGFEYLPHTLQARNQANEQRRRTQAENGMEDLARRLQTLNELQTINLNELRPIPQARGDPTAVEAFARTPQNRNQANEQRGRTQAENGMEALVRRLQTINEQRPIPYAQDDRTAVEAFARTPQNRNQANEQWGYTQAQGDLTAVEALQRERSAIERRRRAESLLNGMHAHADALPPRRLHATTQTTGQIPNENHFAEVRARLEGLDLSLLSAQASRAAGRDLFRENLVGIHDMDDATAQRFAREAWNIHDRIGRINRRYLRLIEEIQAHLAETGRPVSVRPASATTRTATGDAAPQERPRWLVLTSPTGATMVIRPGPVHATPQPGSGGAPAAPEQGGEAPGQARPREQARPRAQAPPQEANAAPNAAPPAANGVVERAIRSAWLFVQLYAIIWMMTLPGSWMRSLGVLFAAAAAWAQSSGFFVRVWRVAVDSFHRQVENLIARPAGAANPENIFWGWLLRVRRALTLLLASLVPGIGEQQVQAHNAAQALAERQRLAPEAAPEEQAAVEQE